MQALKDKILAYIVTLILDDVLESLASEELPADVTAAIDARYAAIR